MTSETIRIGVPPRPSGSARQSAILDALPAPIALLNEEGVIVSVNEAWRRIAGAYGLVDVLHGVGSNYLQVCDEASGAVSEEAPLVAAGIRKILSGEEACFSIEYACHSPGEERWFLLTVTPLEDAPARGAVVMHLDITRRRKTETVLLESEERFSGAFEHAPIGMALVSPDGRQWLRVNRALCDLFGYSEVEFMSRTVLDFTHPDDVEESRRNVLRITQGQSVSFQFEKRYLHRDGHVIDALLDIALVRDDKGEPRYFVSHVQDISERKRTEAQLQESEGRYRALVDTSPESIVVTRNGSVLYVNQATINVMGASSAEELLNKPLLDHVHPDFRGIVQERAMRNALSRGVLPMIEEKFLRADGTVIDAEVRSRAILYNGSPATFSTIRDVTDRRLVEDELRASNQKFQLLADNITDAFWIRSADMSEVLYVSPAFERIWGRPVQSLYASPGRWSDYIHDEDRARVLELFAGLGRNTQSVDVQYRIVRPDGEIRWIRTRGFQVPNEDPTLARNIGIVTDITDQQNAAEALRASESELRASAREQRELAEQLEIERSRLLAAQRLARVGSWQIDMRTQIGVWSEETRRIFETSDESMTHATFTGLVHPEDRPMVDDAFARSLDGTPAAIEHRILLSDGRIKYVEERWQVVLDEEAKPVRAIGTCQDITERKLAEMAVRHSQERLRDIIDGLGPSMFVALLTPAGILVEINRSSLEASGMRAEEMLGKHFADTPWWQQVPSEQRRLRTAIARAARGEASRFDTSAIGANGQVIDLDFSLQPLRDDRGEIVFLIPSASVITDRKRAESALRQAQKMDAVGQLAAGVAHEFNNILQTLLSMATIVRMRAVIPEIIRIAGEMEVQIRRGATVTQQLLVASRNQELSKASLDAREQILKARDLLRRLIPENIELIVETDDEATTIEADPGQIQQVLLNLAINARDAMPDGGTLILRVTATGTEVCIDVQDNGVGFDEATREHLFEPFFTTKDIGKGTGLGLAVVYGIVQQHGGRIEVHSEPGLGSLFRVVLPRSSQIVAAAEPVADAAIAAATGRVLLVEDEEGVREGLAIMLDMFGYEVITASRGEEALALPFVPAPDLLLSDVSLPGIGGPALAALLRERWPEMKVTLMTGHVDSATRGIAQAQGWHILQKPFAMDELGRHLATILNTPLPESD